MKLFGYTFGKPDGPPKPALTAASGRGYADPAEVDRLLTLKTRRPLAPDEVLALRRAIEPDEVRTARLQRERARAQEKIETANLAAVALGNARARLAAEDAQRRAQASADAIEQACLGPMRFWYPGSHGTALGSRLSGRRSRLAEALEVFKDVFRR